VAVLGFTSFAIASWMVNAHHARMAPDDFVPIALMQSLGRASPHRAPDLRLSNAKPGAGHPRSSPTSR
jgi:hypothetical protein